MTRSSRRLEARSRRRMRPCEQPRLSSPPRFSGGRPVPTAEIVFAGSGQTRARSVCSSPTRTAATSIPSWASARLTTTRSGARRPIDCLHSDREGSADLFRVNPDGTGLERLTDNPAYDDQAAFSPDGKQLVFVTTRNGGTADLWTLDLQTKKAKALTSGPGGDFSPSGRPTANGSRSPPIAAARCRWATAAGSTCSSRTFIWCAPTAPG